MADAQAVYNGDRLRPAVSDLLFFLSREHLQKRILWADHRGAVVGYNRTLFAVFHLKAYAHPPLFKRKGFAVVILWLPYDIYCYLILQGHPIMYYMLS